MRWALLPTCLLAPEKSQRRHMGTVGLVVVVVVVVVAAQAVELAVV